MFALTFHSLQEVAYKTYRVCFEKPAGFSFLPGQYLSVVVESQTDIRGGERSLSISSSPEEDFLCFTVRDTGSSFKQAFLSMEKGRHVNALGPFGFLTPSLYPAAPCVFISGGVGISPVRSILCSKWASSLRSCVVFYANRRPEDAAYLQELCSLHASWRVVPIFTADVSGWSGEKGHLSMEMLFRYVRNAKEASYYIAGSPVMIASVEKVLHCIGISASQIHTEEFAGY